MTKETKASAWLDRISTSCLYIIVFLCPLFFLPYTTEILELNKYFLFYLLVIISLMCFLGRGVLLKNFEFRRTPLDIPILALWLAILSTSLLAKERYLSFFGDFGLLRISFLSFSLFSFFYFLVVQQIKKIEQMIRVIVVWLASSVLAILYFIFKSFGLVNISWAGLALPANTVNGSNTLLGIYLAVIFLVALTFLTIKNKRLWLTVFSFLVMVLSLAGLIMIGFKLVWIVMAIALFLTLVIFLTYVEHVYTVWTSFGFAVLVAALLFIFLGVPQFLTLRLPAEVSLGNQASWTIVEKVLTTDPRNFIFGTGLSSFVYNFSRYRPEAFNNNFAWNVRFQQPYSGALDWLASNGLIGSLTFLLVILMVLGLIISTWLKHILEVRQKRKVMEEGAVDFYNSPLIFWGIVAGWLTLLIVFFLANFGFTHWLIFWLFLGLMTTAGAHLSKKVVPVTTISLKASPQYALATSFSFILVFTSLVVLIMYLSRFYTAEVIYVGAVKQPLDKKVESLQNAIVYNNHRAAFYLALADAFFNQAIQISRNGGDTGQITNVVASAVNSAKTATDISPNNVATWEFLSAMYANARPVAPEANNWVISSLEKAIQLESTNPLFYVGLGNAKLLERRYSEAKDNFNKAMELKPDLLVAYIRLALLQETQNNPDEAMAALEKGLTYGRNDAGYVFQLGLRYFNRRQKGDDGMAELAFRRAIALTPSYSDALYALGLLYERTNNKSQALQLYRRVLELNPDNNDLKAKINALVSGSAPK